MSPWEFDPELDLLQRYEQMIQTQVDTLNGIDDKAAFVGRFVGLLASLVLSATSVVVGTQEVQLSLETGGVFSMLGLAVLAFFVSLVYAIITYLSSRFEYGPAAGLGSFMADYHIEEQDYRDMMLRGYSEAIQANRRVIATNSKRFERCLASFLAGVLFLFAAGVLLVLPGILLLHLVVGLLFGIAAVILTRYILRGDYLTLERRQIDDE